MDLVIDNDKRMIKIDSKYQWSVVDLLNNYSINISSEKWRSKLDICDEYDYAPWITDGFDYEMYFNDKLERMFDFAAFLITAHLEHVEHLERCLAEV